MWICTQSSGWLSSCCEILQAQLQTRVYADTQPPSWNIDSLQLRMSLADVYYQTSACLQLVWTKQVDLRLKIHQIRWQGMRRL